MYVCNVYLSSAVKHDTNFAWKMKINVIKKKIEESDLC